MRIVSQSRKTLRRKEKRRRENQTMGENIFPITNNPRLIFIPYNKTDSSSTRECLDLDQNNDVHSDVDSCEDSIGPKIRDFFVSSYLYCLILGSISLMSGLLLSIIAFHGLNSNNITPIMGKKEEIKSQENFILGFTFRSCSDIFWTWFRHHWIVPLFEQAENVE